MIDDELDDAATAAGCVLAFILTATLAIVATAGLLLWIVGNR